MNFLDVGQYTSLAVHYIGRAMKACFSGLVILLCVWPTAFRCRAAETEQYEQEPFNYSDTAPRDGVSLLEKQISSGELKLGSTDREVVEGLLRRLQIPVESQLLVFSRTSFQREQIRAEHPRALYFNDNCYVGWVPGGLVEITALDPVLGPMFYTFAPAAAQTNAARCFIRETDCLRCHGGTFIRGIPGLLARSTFPDDQSDPITRFGSEVVDLRTPFTNRWGGWYVTGFDSENLHRGNRLFSGQSNKSETAKVMPLTDRFDVKAYLAEGSSDVVALLVFEQQLTIQNALTRASLDCRRMLDYQEKLQVAFKTPVTEEPEYESVKSVFEHTAQDVVDDLLFKDEAALPPGIRGSTAFQKAFLANARKTSDGNSLKDLQLNGHLFRNRCSYLIYSESFRGLPAPLKRRIYARLARALRAGEPDPRYAYLDSAERGRILSIIRETAPEPGSALAGASSEMAEHPHVGSSR
jgi:hypothetical protein